MVGYEEVLTYIKGQEEVTIPELQREFSSDYLTIAKIVQRLISEGILKLASGVKYAVCLKDKEDEIPNNDISRQRAYLEARRRAIFKGMREEEDDELTDDLEDDEDDEDDEGGEDDEDDDLSDDMPLAVYATFRDLNKSVSIIKSDEKHFIVPHGLKCNGEQVRMRISFRADGVYLTDDLLTFGSLGDRAPSGDDERIRVIAARCGITIDSDELEVKIESPQDTVPRMMQLFAAMKRIVALAEEDAFFAEYREEDDRIWGIAREYLTANPEMDRGALVCRIRERYQSVKDGDDVDEIILSARGIKEFTRMSDEIYLKSRTILLEEAGKNGSDEGEVDERRSASDEGMGMQGNLLPAEEIKRTAEIIMQTLVRFHIDVTVTKVTVGASVARFELAVARDVSVSAVVRRGAELAMCLGQKDGVRVYTGAENGQVYVEVPRPAFERERVEADKLLGDGNSRWENKSALYFAVGKDLEGDPVYGDLARLKHILIGGSCGSGKSSFLHTMIYSFITKYSPDEVRLILCDARQTEFMCYQGMPYLLTGQIVTGKEQMVHALRWAHGEMERRYQLFERKTAAGDAVRDIDEYNATCRKDEKILPRIVIIVEEYADFLASAKRDIEATIQRLAQKARAAGIHLVFATQRPSVDVVTGVLKTNFPTRIAFRMIQEMDSRTVLDEGGAEKLLGFGDMLMRSEADFWCKRIQSAHIPQETLMAAVAATKKMYESKFNQSAQKYIKRIERKATSASEEAPSASCIKALAIVIQMGEASISLVQRKCCVGYNHAGQIIEWMENMGYISPFNERTKRRNVLITKEQFIKKYGPLD